MIAAIKKRHYSCWIDPDNQVRSQAPDNENALYNLGYVKVDYIGGATLKVTGDITSLRNSRNRWVALASSVDQIEMQIVSESNKSPILTNNPSFKYPSEISELDCFLKD